MIKFERVDYPIKDDDFAALGDEEHRQLDPEEAARRANYFWRIAKLKLEERSHLLTVSAGEIVIDKHQSVRIYLGGALSAPSGKDLSDLYAKVERAIRNMWACKIVFRKGSVIRSEWQPDWKALLSKAPPHTIHFMAQLTKQQHPPRIQNLRRGLLPNDYLEHYGLSESQADIYFAEFFISHPALEINGFVFRLCLASQKKDRLANSHILVRDVSAIPSPSVDSPALKRNRGSSKRSQKFKSASVKVKHKGKCLVTKPNQPVDWSPMWERDAQRKQQLKAKNDQKTVARKLDLTTSQQVPTETT